MNKMEFIADKKKYDGSTPLKRIKFEKFIQWYLKTNNVTLSAINAGYPSHSAAVKGSQIKNREDVQLRYNYLMSKLANAKLWSKEKIIERIQEEIEKTTKTWEKLKGLELLGRTKGAFVDKMNVKHSGKVEGQPNNIFVTNKETAAELKKIIN